MIEAHPLFVDHLNTPLGRFAVVADQDGVLVSAGFTTGHAPRKRPPRRIEQEGGLVAASNPGGLTKVLERYFAGDVRVLDTLRVRPQGTDFQLRVWRALREIPCGETWSYAELAVHIGNPSAVRAVGLANGANPIAVVVPCHRVIGADGSLTGYGGGLERKRWLLAHEGWKGDAARQEELLLYSR
jgi:methylated-DNA-[protein]-cysteine S-methyltransferase